VSHNLSVVSRVCHRAFLLRDGFLVATGECRSVIDNYLASDELNILVFRRQLNLTSAPRYAGSGEARIVGIEAIDPRQPHRDSSDFTHGDITFRFRITGDLNRVKGVAVQICDLSDRKLINANSFEKMTPLTVTPNSVVDLTIHDVRLRPGKYKLGFWIGDALLRPLDVVIDACILEVLPRPGMLFDERHEGFFFCPFDVRVHHL
jgi:hypothetical protein